MSHNSPVTVQFSLACWSVTHDISVSSYLKLRILAPKCGKPTHCEDAPCLGYSSSAQETRVQSVGLHLKHCFHLILWANLCTIDQKVIFCISHLAYYNFSVLNSLFRQHIYELFFSLACWMCFFQESIYQFSKSTHSRYVIHCKLLQSVDSTPSFFPSQSLFSFLNHRMSHRG